MNYTIRARRGTMTETTEEVTATVEADKLLTVKQAAEFYQVHEETIRKWNRCDALPVVRIGPSKSCEFVPPTSF